MTISKKQARYKLARIARRREQLAATGSDLADETADAIIEARSTGLTLSAIGEVLNVTHQRVAQLTERRTDDRRESND